MRILLGLTRECRVKDAVKSVFVGDKAAGGVKAWNGEVGDFVINA
jgi:hypothetical protein